MEAVLSGKYDVNRLALMMSQTGGCCRASNYVSFIRRALEKAGMYERTEGLWQTWQDFLDLGCTTFPETPYSPRSDCHGWSALPLWESGRKDASP